MTANGANAVSYKKMQHTKRSIRMISFEKYLKYGMSEETLELAL